jgi:hypothetical protein
MIETITGEKSTLVITINQDMEDANLELEQDGIEENVVKIIGYLKENNLIYNI